ncbi:MAG TPA: DUF58 domain-containing protein [Candidatus Eubacterium avistercoris]|uniref:DUF58 domain-containing protein n=1 Tax=Candidatus Eubacterium avistercoris TaxID=2838567 RepID=A0A9D2D4J2_9FIRM|nr:DUF58 domain-containing protein [Candidatus Eubacterium avistercoris]
MKAGKINRKENVREKILFFCALGAAASLYFFTDADFPAFLTLLLLVYLLAAFLIIRCSGKKLEYDFEGPVQGEKKETVPVCLHVKNNGLLPVIKCCLHLSAENILTGEKIVRREVLALPPRGEKKVLFTLTDAYCGQIEMKVDRAAVEDPLSVFQRERECGGKKEYYVMPSMQEIRLSEESVSHYDMESFRYSSEKKGIDPSETFDLRGYMPGDSIKMIHWKLSGKLGDLIVREPGLPVENSLMMILDKKIPEEENPDPREAAGTAELLVSLSQGAIKLGIAHTIGWYNYARKSFVTFKIKSREDIFRALPELLSSPCRKDRISSAERFLEADSDKDFACFFYVAMRGSNGQNETERLKQYGNVTIYRTENEEP